MDLLTFTGGLTTPAYRSIINMPKTKSVVQDPSNPDRKLVLFRVSEFGRSAFLVYKIGCVLMNRFKQADLGEAARKFLKWHDATITTHDIDLVYHFWNAGETAFTLGDFH